MQLQQVLPCQIKKREQCNQKRSVEKSSMLTAPSFIKVGKTFHLKANESTSPLELQCAKSIPYHQSSVKKLIPPLPQHTVEAFQEWTY